MNNINMADIEQAAKKYAEAREQLSGIVSELNAEIELAKRTRLAAIKRAVAKAAERQGTLSNLIDQSRSLFEKPRTQIFHGVKLGLQKGKGGLTWDDDEQVIKLIHRHFPDQEDQLIKTTEKPIKTALNQLSAGELKKLGIEVEETGDQILIKPCDSEVDKVVNALLQDAVAQEEAA